MSFRKRLQGTALTSAVQKTGVDAINSDEEVNGVLDETQQEAFITQMNLLVGQYISRWKSFFSWTSLLIIYIRILDLIGIMIGNINIEFKSLFLNLAISPLFLSSSFSFVFISIFDLFAIYFIITNRMIYSRMYAFASLCIHLYLGGTGRHLVVAITVPLLCVASETFSSAQSDAKEGLNKLVKFKYPHKKAYMFFHSRTRAKYVFTPVARVPSLLSIGEVNLAKLSNREFGLYFQNSVDISGIRLLGQSGLFQAIESRLDLMTPKDFYRTLIGLAKCNVLSESILILINDKLVQDAAQLRVHEICNLAIEIAVSKNVHCQSLVLFLSTIFSKKIFAANPIDLAHISMAVAQMDIIDNDLMERIALATCLQIGLCRGPELADILAAFSILKCHSEMLFNKSIPHLASKKHTLHPIQLSYLPSLACAYISAEYIMHLQYFFETKIN